MYDAARELPNWFMWIVFTIGVGDVLTIAICWLYY
jgi:hypothetical protein